MTKGFSLLEVVICLALMLVALTVITPSFTSLFNTSSMNGFQNDVRGIVHLAKSNAVMKNAPLYLHLRNLTHQEPSQRCIVLSTAKHLTDCNTQAIMILLGSQFERIDFTALSQAPSLIPFDRVRGWPDLAANDFDENGFANVMQFYSESDKPVTMQLHATGRLRFCGNGGAWYDNEECG